MSDRQASRTALATANMRAAHQILDPPPRILEDPFALPVIGPEAVQRIRETADYYETPQRRYFRSHVVLRSRYAEDCLETAVSGGATQYVILGAGFDTFAVRQPSWARSLRIIEVDHPATQLVKRSRLAGAGLEMPHNVEFVTIDFERESLLDGLVRHGLSPEGITFFSCLGVTMYLQEKTIDDMFESIATFPGGSGIVLTHAPPPRDSSAPVSPLAVRAANVGEPWVTYLDVEALTAKLRRAGFSGRISPLSPIEAEERYFHAHVSNHEGTRIGDLPAPKRTHILTAEV
jgi:methyltransferase (TIGR00027 family)